MFCVKLNQGRPEPDKAGRLARSPATDGPATGQRVHKLHKTMQTSVVHSEWKSGLCDCCSKPVCCEACCCPCCVYGQILAAMEPNEAACGGNYCGACCCFYALHSISQLIDSLFILFFAIPVGTIVFPFAAIVHYPARKAIRQKHNISGSDCDDCLTVWCCMCCALVQVDCLPTFNTLFFPDDDCLDRSTASSTRSIP